MIKLQNKPYLQYFPVIIAGILIFFMPLYRWFLPSIILGYGISWLFSGNFKQKFNEITINWQVLFNLCLLLLFLINIFGYFYSTDKITAAENIEQKLSLLLLPILLIGFHKLFIKYSYTFLKLFVAGNFLAGIISVFRAIFRSISVSAGTINFDFSTLQSHLGFLESGINGGNYFLYIEFSTFLHPAYWAMYLCLALSFLFVLKEKKEIPKGKQTVLYYVIVAFFMLLILMLSSRAGILSGIIVVGSKIIYNVFNSKNLRLKILFPSLFVVSLIFVFSNPRFHSAITEFRGLLNTETSITENKNLSERFMMWKSSYAVAKENFWIGTGTGDMKTKINQQYRLYNPDNKEHIELNAHNEYLETFASSGIFALIILLLFIVFGVFQAIKTKNNLLLIFMILISFNFIFESMLNTISGVVFIAFFYPFLNLIHSDASKKEKV